MKSSFLHHLSNRTLSAFVISTLFVTLLNVSKKNESFLTLKIVKKMLLVAHMKVTLNKQVY